MFELVDTGNQQSNKEVDLQKVFYVFWKYKYTKIKCILNTFFSKVLKYKEYFVFQIRIFKYMLRNIHVTISVPSR